MSTFPSFNWTAAITRNHAELVRLGGLLIASIGKIAGDAIPRAAYRTALSKLRPLESALRRLIVIAARDVEAKLDGRPMPSAGTTGKVSARRRSSFPLFDPRRQIRPNPVKAAPPMIRLLEDAAPSPAPTHVDASILRRRIERMQRALNRLPFEAKRLARWRLRAPHSWRRPMRPGRPPGFSDRKKKDAAQEVLSELQTLALWAEEESYSERVRC